MDVAKMAWEAALKAQAGEPDFYVRRRPSPGYEVVSSSDPMAQPAYLHSTTERRVIPEDELSDRLNKVLPMSCEHGNHVEDCDLCDAVDAAYKAGQASADERVKELEESVLEEAIPPEGESMTCKCEHWQTCDECKPPQWGIGQATLRRDEEQAKNELKDGKRIDPREIYPKFQLGDTVKKIKGSQWHGTVVGTYSTALTPEGYAVESSTEKGSVQIYPAAALEKDE